MPSATHDRITARSSAQVEMWGSQSEIHMPLLPCCCQVRFEASRGELYSPIAVITLPKLSGIFCPASSLSLGFGSNESMCEGPPSMKRKITLFALGEKCGFFGASGLASAASAAAREVPC